MGVKDWMSWTRSKKKKADGASTKEARSNSKTICATKRPKLRLSFLAKPKVELDQKKTALKD